MRSGRKLPTGFAVRFASLRSGGAADWRSGPRWSILSVLCPVHPFASLRHFPSRGNEKIGGTGYCVTYDTDSQSRNADFISIALRAIRNPRGQRPRQTQEPLGRRPIHLENLSLHNPSTHPAAGRRPQPSGQRPVNPHTEGVSL